MIARDAFATAWTSALAASASLDAAEPEATRQALAALDRHERAVVGEVLQGEFLLSHLAQSLLVLGLVELVGRQSRKIAREDPQFSQVARAIWDPASGGPGLLVMLNLWGVIPDDTRSRLTAAALARTPADWLLPDVHGWIIELEGRAWAPER